MAFLDSVVQARQYMDFHPTLAFVAFIVLATALVLNLLYRLALPKPIPGIPYNASSARKIFGDIPAMVSHITHDDGTFITYIVSTLQTLNAPLVQVFIRPLSSPLLVLSDFREAHDLMTRRKDFDRSSSSGDLVKALAPDHHIHLKTTAAWRAQRQLVQDLMTPSFLHNVAGPVIHQEASVMIELWRTKSRIADGRPWTAGEDIDHVALDAVMAFAFGEEFGHSATRPELEAVKRLDVEAVEVLRSKGGRDEPLEFPKGQVDEVLQATLDVTATVEEVQGSPLPGLKWAYVMRKPRIKRATKIKEDYIMKELKDAVARLEGSKGNVVRSAVDHMIGREKGLAEKYERKPDYFSRIMIDEVSVSVVIDILHYTGTLANIGLLQIFGFVVAGHDTTSTTVCWGLKYLAENPAAQTKLRTALQTSFAAARLEGRNPTIGDITSTHIAYLNAIMEEVLRCSGTVPIVDRQAVVDTELLGHRILKGTVVSCLVTGPSMTSPAFNIDKARRGASSRAAEKEGALDKAWDPEDMMAFKPERWLVRGGKGDEEFDGAAGPQLAFGLGTRQCFGKRLAYLELRILMTLIVWNFELLPCPEALSGHKPVLIMTSRPKDCYVRLREVELSAPCS